MESGSGGSKYVLFKIREESILEALEEVRSKEAQLLEDLRAATHDHGAARLRDVGERLGDACDRAEACVQERCQGGRTAIAACFEAIRASLDARQRVLERDLDEAEARDLAALATVRRELGLVLSAVDERKAEDKAEGKGPSLVGPDMPSLEAAQDLLGSNLRALREALCDPSRDVSVDGLGMSGDALISSLGRVVPLVALGRAAPPPPLGSPVSVIGGRQSSHAGVFPMPKHIITPWSAQGVLGGSTSTSTTSSSSSSRANSICDAEVGDQVLNFGPHAFPTIVSLDAPPPATATDEEQAERFIRHAIGLTQGPTLNYRAAALTSGA